jgi:hypothetical protein
VRSHRVLVVWLLLAALIGLVAAVEYGDVMAARSARSAPADQGKLLPWPVEHIGAVELADAGALHRFERDAAGAWFYHGVHTASEAAHTHASDASTATRIEQAFQAFGRTRIERRLPAGADPRVYGLTAPRLLVLVYRPNARQPLAQYAVGDVAPDAMSRYVDVVGGAGVVTIPGYQVDNLLALLDAVKSGPPAR